MFIGDWMARGEMYWPERVAVVDVVKGSKGRFTYRELNRRANALAAWFRDQAGVRRGDRVALLAHNGVEYLDVFFACAKLGALFVPLNWRLHPTELAELLEQTSPQLVIHDGEHLALATDVKARLTRRPAWLHIGSEGTQGSHRYDDALATAAAPVSNELVQAEDIACLLFTGGTTGLPKAAELSYRMIAWNTLNTLIHEVRPGDVTLTHTPMFHTGGLFVYTTPLLTSGGTVVLMRRWDAGEMLELIRRERPTVLFCVPTQFQELLARPEFSTTDFSSLRFLTSGGAPLPVSVIEGFQKVHPVPFKQGFGMTEFGPGVCSMAPEDSVRKTGSIGKPNMFIDACLLDDAGKPVPDGTVGELCLKGPCMFSGYFNNPRATAECIDGQGWFHTGDLAVRDAEGFYAIVDRKKDMFISGGENVFPIEIERALYEHPAVHQCAAVGVPDEKWGEVGRAYVVPKEGNRVTAPELLEHLRSRLARYKVPKLLELVPSLPLSPAGKILRRTLRDQARAALAPTDAARGGPASGATASMGAVPLSPPSDSPDTGGLKSAGVERRS